MHKDHKDDNDNAEDYVIDLLVKSIKSIRSGTINVNMENEPAIQINADINRIDIDILHPEFLKLFTSSENEENEDKRGRIEKAKDKLHNAKEFAEKLTDNETGLLDKLDIPKEFAQKLTDNDMTIVLSRKGKEAIILGKEAKPTVSKLVSRSDDMQIKSVREVTKLGSDLKPEDD
ncbi:MAG TPA: hypothetical protein VI278_08450 [Nitrososphaeraceae archaeon]